MTSTEAVQLPVTTVFERKLLWSPPWQLAQEESEGADVVERCSGAHSCVAALQERFGVPQQQPMVRIHHVRLPLSHGSLGLLFFLFFLLVLVFIWAIEGLVASLLQQRLLQRRRGLRTALQADGPRQKPLLRWKWLLVLEKSASGQLWLDESICTSAQLHWQKGKNESNNIKRTERHCWDNMQLVQLQAFKQLQKKQWSKKQVQIDEDLDRSTAGRDSRLSPY